MNFFSTIHADLRERQILPAVVVLAVLVVAIPLGASFALSGVSTTPPPALPPTNVKLAKGVAPPAQELAVLSTPPPLQYHKRSGSEPNPFREQSGTAGSAGGAAKVSTSTGTAPKSTTTTPKTTTTTSPRPPRRRRRRRRQRQRPRRRAPRLRRPRRRRARRSPVPTPARQAVRRRATRIPPRPLRRRSDRLRWPPTRPTS